MLAQREFTERFMGWSNAAIQQYFGENYFIQRGVVRNHWGQVPPRWLLDNFARAGVQLPNRTRCDNEREDQTIPRSEWFRR